MGTWDQLASLPLEIEGYELAGRELPQVTHGHAALPADSGQLARPYVIAGVNVIAADTQDAAAEQLLEAKRRRARLLFGRGRTLSPEEADAILASPTGLPALEMLRYCAVGTPNRVTEYLDWFADHADADELILASAAPEMTAKLRSLELVAHAYGLAPAA
jgi:alkanesulfonate monooxygenase SsuD/methylene tetrahydromethanopterin reductase-like flavin-dependent oxidoreductase (luciferase family)